MYTFIYIQTVPRQVGALLTYAHAFPTQVFNLLFICNAQLLIILGFTTPAAAAMMAPDVPLNGALAFTRYCFTSKLHCGSPSSVYSPPSHLQHLPYCNTGARPLRNVHPPTDPPCVCMPHTIQYW